LDIFYLSVCRPKETILEGLCFVKTLLQSSVITAEVLCPACGVSAPVRDVATALTYLFNAVEAKGRI